MKLLKLAVLICGAMGIAGLLMIGIELLLETNQRTNTILLLVAFGLPVVMGGIALARPPMQAWQAGVSLAGSSLAVWKLEIWSAFGRFGQLPNGQRLMVVGAVVGAIVAIVAILRPEDGWSSSSPPRGSTS